MITCPQCSKEFTPGRPHQKFCSPKCRIGNHGDGGLRGAVRAVRKCKGDVVRVTVEFPAEMAFNALQIAFGSLVEVVK